jgi:drug/metabolite transporter (DMT)-like permease
MNIPVVLAVISLVCMGLSSFMNKVAVADGLYFPPFLIIGNVFYIIVALIIHINQKQAFVVNPRMLLVGGLLGLFGSIGYVCMFYALNNGGAGSVVFPIVGLGVIVSVSLSAIIYQEPFTATRLLGLGLGVGSIVLLSR